MTRNAITWIKIISLFLCCLIQRVNAQDTVLSKEAGFIGYLIENRQFSDASGYLNLYYNNLQSYSQSKRDTINYLKGIVYYHSKILDTSSMFFNQVSPSSPFYVKSRFYSAFNLSYESRSGASDSILKEVSSEAALKNLYLAGNSLLRRDTASYSLYAKNFDERNILIAEHEAELKERYKEIKKIKRKSPLLAATMSAIIPGSGKFYAGYRGKAISSFLPVMITGVAATENYIRNGPLSPGFIVFAGLFGIFYTGSIYGSAISVKIHNQEMNHDVNQSILVNLNVPLRKIFEE